MRAVSEAVLKVLLAAVAVASGPARAQTGERIRGTAFVVNPSGYLLTSLHVVKNAAHIDASIEGTGYEAAVVASDEVRNLALLRVRGENLPALPLADSGAVEVGQEVRAFGYPLTSALGTSLKVTRGSISGIEMEEKRQVFQVDATINPGNSGGPLVNEKGEAVGVVIARLTEPGAGNVGFVVPINEAKALLRGQMAAFGGVGAAEKLEGPALVKRVSPSLALLTVTPGEPPAAASPAPATPEGSNPKPQPASAPAAAMPAADAQPTEADAQKQACQDVSREVERIRQGNSVPLPRPQVDEGGAGETFSWHIVNDTGSALTVFFDGPEKRAVVVEARRTRDVTLPAGVYEVAARIGKPNVLPLYGRFELAGGGRYRWRLFLAGR